MTRITEAYCSKEIYRFLIEKGFDGEVHTTFDEEGYTQPSITLQMAMKWLREVHNIFIIIEPHAYDYVNEKNKSCVASLWQGDNYYENILSKDYPTYEEAVDAALKYSLENLI